MIIEEEKLDKIDEVIKLLDEYKFPQSINNRGKLIAANEGQQKVREVKNNLEELRYILVDSSEIKGSLKTFDMPDFEEITIKLNKKDFETMLLNGGFIDLGERETVKNMLNKYIYDADEEKRFINKVKESKSNPIKNLSELDE